MGLWTTRLSRRCPCPWQGGWNEMIFKVTSNPNHSMILPPGQSSCRWYTSPWQRAGATPLSKKISFITLKFWAHCLPYQIFGAVFCQQMDQSSKTVHSVKLLQETVLWKQSVIIVVFLWGSYLLLCNQKSRIIAKKICWPRRTCQILLYKSIKNCNDWHCRSEHPFNHDGHLENWKLCQIPSRREELGVQGENWWGGLLIWLLLELMGF